MKIDRDKALEHLRRGWPVVHDGAQIDPAHPLHGSAAGRSLAEARLPPEEAGGEFVATRHDDGTHTRAGLEQVIKSGGAILHNGQTIDRLDGLPDEGELARGNEAREKAVLAGIDSQVAQLMAQRQRLEAQRQAAEAQTGPRPAEEKPAGESDAQRRERERREVEERDRQRQAAESERQRQQAEAEQQAQRKKK